MNKKQNTSDRKEEHLLINIENDVKSKLSTGFETYHFIHEALPEINFSDVDISLSIFGKSLKAPLLISPMTGGSDPAREWNLLFGRAAQEFGIVVGLGSQRAAIEDIHLRYSYDIRKVAPDAVIFANLGAIQLNYEYGIRECEEAVNMVTADALVLHLNPLQEILQPEGQTLFRDLLIKIEKICRSLSVPVIVKEVGWGINHKTARRLIDAGVSAIDVAGAGGTSWSQVEKFRHSDLQWQQIAANFQDWGIPTARCIREIKENCPGAILIGSGGIKNGIDLAKSLALGTRIGGMAGPFLRAAAEGYDSLTGKIQQTITELKICLFVCGKKNLAEFDEKVLTQE